MTWKDLKYLLAYTTPLSCWISLSFDGLASYTTLIFLFVMIPLLEQAMPKHKDNHDPKIEKSRSGQRFFDILLYINLPILYALLYQYLTLVRIGDLGLADLVGKTLAIGMIIGSIGINVAHEIGHRPEWYNQFVSRMMLMSALYMHFNIEHNRGHHKRVATPEDPATSRFGESFYSFWWRSVTGGFMSAWSISSTDAHKSGNKWPAINHLMSGFLIIEFTYMLSIYYFFGSFALVMSMVAAVLGFTLLEAVNYIEHYGLVREKLPSGKYETVNSSHSWNSNHEIGRVLLYELTRHSDHHYKSTRKYQVLRHFDESPQLPYGYPASILLSLIPSFWFSIMHREMEKTAVPI